MATPDTPLDAAFLDQQRKALEALRDELASDTAANDEETGGLTAATGDEQFGDQAQATELRDNNEAVVAQQAARLPAIERALQKIEEGTYGRSDESGDTIPRARLEAVPEAATTIEEEAQREVAERADTPTFTG